MSFQLVKRWPLQVTLNDFLNVMDIFHHYHTQRVSSEFDREISIQYRTGPIYLSLSIDGAHSQEVAYLPRTRSDLWRVWRAGQSVTAFFLHHGETRSSLPSIHYDPSGSTRIIRVNTVHAPLSLEQSYKDVLRFVLPWWWTVRFEDNMSDIINLVPF